MTSILEVFLKYVTLILILFLTFLGCKKEELPVTQEPTIINNDIRITINPVNRVPNKKLLQKIEDEEMISAFRVDINNCEINDLSLVSKILLHQNSSEYIKEPSTLVFPIDLSFSSEIYCVITRKRDLIKLYQTDLGVIIGGTYSIKDLQSKPQFIYTYSSSNDLVLGQALTLLNYSTLDNREDLTHNMTDAWGAYLINTNGADQFTIDLAIYKNYMFK